LAAAPVPPLPAFELSPPSAQIRATKAVIALLLSLVLLSALALTGYYIMVVRRAGTPGVVITDAGRD
jgi:hypothetical protein